MREGARAASKISAAEEPIVFIIDDDPLVLSSLSSLFRSIGLRVEAFASATELLQHPLSADNCGGFRPAHVEPVTFMEVGHNSPILGNVAERAFTLSIQRRDS
jgi:hypothetical protein